MLTLVCNRFDQSHVTNCYH